MAPAPLRSIVDVDLLDGGGEVEQDHRNVSHDYDKWAWSVGSTTQMIAKERGV